MKIRNKIGIPKRLTIVTIIIAALVLLCLDQARINTVTSDSVLINCDGEKSLLSKNNNSTNNDKTSLPGFVNGSDVDNVSTRNNNNNENYFLEFNSKLPICTQLQGKSAAAMWRTKQKTTTTTSLASASDWQWWLIEASMHPKDKKQAHRSWITKLANWIASQPQLLAKANRAIPDDKQINHVLQIVQRKLQDPINEPPLRVVVFGGSVTEGRNCNALPGEFINLVRKDNNATANNNKNNNNADFDQILDKIRGPHCAWPYRLQYLINYVLSNGQMETKYPIIKIYNLAVGGTNSNAALPIMKYRFYRNKELQLYGPDIIINAYGANDNHFGSSNLDVQSRYNRALHRAQSFIRFAKTYHMQQQIQQHLQQIRSNNNNNDNCTHHATMLLDKYTKHYYKDNDNNIKPLMIYFMNEYLGNLNEFIITEHVRDSVVQFLSDYYDVGYVSYAHAVQKFVYTTTQEKLFSPRWKKQKDSHIFMTGHVMIPWVIAYNVLSTLIDFCDNNNNDSTPQEQQIRHQKEETTDDIIDGMRFENDDLSLHLKSRQELVDRLSDILPPEINNNLTLTSISNQWEQDYKDQQTDIIEMIHLFCNTTKKENNNNNKLDQQALDVCPFAFVASHTGTVRRATSLNAYINRFKVGGNNTNKGWKGQDDIRKGGWQNKVGLMSHNATNKDGSQSILLLKIPNIKIPIRKISIQHLKSYGELWNGSVAQFELFGKAIINDNSNDNDDVNHNNNLFWSANITGYHNSTTSISYSEDATLDPPVPVGTTVYLKITHMTGHEFKIMSILLCSW